MCIESKYSVCLTDEQRLALREIVDDPKTLQTRRIRAEILLDLDGIRKPYALVKELIALYGVTKPLINLVMKKFDEGGIEAMKKSPNPVPRKPHK